MQAENNFNWGRELEELCLNVCSREMRDVPPTRRSEFKSLTSSWNVCEPDNRQQLQRCNSAADPVVLFPHRRGESEKRIFPLGIDITTRKNRIHAANNPQKNLSSRGSRFAGNMKSCTFFYVEIHQWTIRYPNTHTRNKHKQSNRIQYSPFIGPRSNIIYRVFVCALSTANKASFLAGRPLTYLFLKVLCKKIYGSSNRELKRRLINKHTVTRQTYP